MHALLLCIIPITVIFWYSFSYLLTFSWINNQSLADKFSPVHFMAPGNNFVGGILRLTTKSLPVDIQISLAGQTRNCNKQVRGIYFNSQRGKRAWPLDQSTLTLLQETDPLYAQLQILGWLYTSCTEDNYSIFGQINYNRANGTTSEIIAGTTLDYLGNKYGNGGSFAFANSLQYFNNQTPIGYLRDSYGGIGFVGGNMNWHADLISFLNNGWNINDAFQQTGTDITSTTGGRGFTSNIIWNNASNIIRNLLVQGSVGLSQSMREKDIISLLGNPQEKTVILGTENINNATLINQAKKNTEKLCKGKTWSTNTSLTTSNDSVLCFGTTNLSIDLQADEALYQDKTIIMRSGNIVLSNSMESAAAGIDIFVDQGNIYLENNVTNMQSFDNQWYPGWTNTINSWTLIRGNIIINWLMIGGTPSNETGYNHKLYIQGKISTLNTPFAPTQARINFIGDILWIGLYDNRINLQNVFVWNCFLSGSGSDGSACTDTHEIASIPLVIVDGKYSTTLLDN